MARFKQRVERLRPLVMSIVDPQWVDLVLAIIQRESGGVIGRKAGAKTRVAVKLLRDDGTYILYQRALGLMQVIPLIIKNWNNTHTDKATFERMSGGTMLDAHYQVKLGWWTLKSNFKSINDLLPEIPAIGLDGRMNPPWVRYVLVTYRWGIGNLRKKIKQLRAEGRSTDWNTFIARFPNLGGSKNRVLLYVRHVTSSAGFPGTGEIDNGRPPDNGTPRPGAGGALIALLAIPIVVGLMRR